MPRATSVTEARDRFPVVVTSRNRPQVVTLRRETYRHRRDLQVEGARHRLQALVAQMEELAAGLREAYAPGSLDLAQGTRDLLTLARQTWAVCRSLDEPRRHLASALAEGDLVIALALPAGMLLYTTNPLPPNPSWSTELVSALSQADRALGELASLGRARNRRATRRSRRRSPGPAPGKEAGR